MGHNRLSRIPGSKYWREVVALLAGAVPTQDIVSASAKAAEHDMFRASDDPVFVEAIRLLLALPLAARADDFSGALRSQGLVVPGEPELVDLIVAVTQRLDDVARSAGRRSDFGELAGRALTRTLSTTIGGALPGLFDETSTDMQAALRKHSWSKGISKMTRGFFGNLVSETLSYWLDRTLDENIGPNQRFSDFGDRSTFDVELSQFATEATRIIEEFSGGWYSKTLNRRGGFGETEAAAFGAVALKKIVEELRRKQERHA